MGEPAVWQNRHRRISRQRIVAAKLPDSLKGIRLIGLDWAP